MEATDPMLYRFTQIRALLMKHISLICITAWAFLRDIKIMSALLSWEMKGSQRKR